jgi:hypothetical protein
MNELGLHAADLAGVAGSGQAGRVTIEDFEKFISNLEKNKLSAASSMRIAVADGVVPQSDAFHHTNKFMNLTRQYIGDQLDEEFSVSKTDKIDLLNRSMKFFKSRDQFDQNEFESEVLEDVSVIESFRNYERSLNTDDDIANHFEISAQAVKRQARVFKSVLKLDKNFHIYIHGNRDLIEKGFDPGTNRQFYKIYFDQET